MPVQHRWKNKKTNWCAESVVLGPRVAGRPIVGRPIVARSRGMQGWHGRPRRARVAGQVVVGPRSVPHGAGCRNLGVTRPRIGPGSRNRIGPRCMASSCELLAGLFAAKFGTSIVGRRLRSEPPEHTEVVRPKRYLRVLACGGDNHSLRSPESGAGGLRTVARGACPVKRRQPLRLRTWSKGLQQEGSSKADPFSTTLTMTLFARH